MASIYTYISWDGKVYNNESGNEEVVEEGQYYLNYKAKVDGDNNTYYQDFIMPVKVDLTPIKSNLLSNTKSETSDYKLELNFNGELENGNFNQLLIAVNGEVLSDEIISTATVDGDNLSIDLTLVDNCVNSIEVLTLDNAYNTGDDVFEIAVGDSEAIVKLVNFPDSAYFHY